ncbi:MAG: hypothetical protein V1494_03500 [Candidatus Diapherotrites archaeon]
MGKNKILVFGNPLVEGDSLALKVARELKGGEIEFVELDALDELEEFGKSPAVLDVAKGIRKVKLIDNLDALELSPRCSMHDFDLAIHLKLLKKLGKIDSAKIICIPMGYDEGKAVSEVRLLLKSI